MGTLIEAARLGGKIVHKAIELHKAGVDTNIIEAVHSAVKAAHDVIHGHWSKHVDKTKVDDIRF